MVKRLPVPLVLLLLAGSGACGGDSGTASDLDPATSTPATPEAITAQGVAGVARDAVGADLIESYSVAGESDSVGVRMQLAGRQVLVVTVQITGDVQIDSCADLRETAMAGADCGVDEDGTITASGRAEPFSDDNVRGSTVLAQSVNPKSGRVVYALFETYTRQAALDPDTLRAIVSNPALAAMTDPATNEAGSDIELMAEPN